MTTMTTPTAEDMTRAVLLLNGSSSDRYTGRRFGRLIALHRMRAPRGITRLALACDCGRFCERTTPVPEGTCGMCDDMRATEEAP